MKLSDVKLVLKEVNVIGFQLPNGEWVPNHFHVTEVGKVVKQFIDCGGALREEEVVNFQLWNANDYDHRLHPEKLLSIIELSEKKLGLHNTDVEVEYQTESKGFRSIGKYGLEFNGGHFMLTSKQTDCLAKDQCGIIPQEKKKVKLSELNNEPCCSPDGNCC